MRAKVWENSEGWSVTLIVREGKGASVTLYKDGRTRLYKTYDWHETRRAESDAEAFVSLGLMSEVQRSRRA